MTLLLWLLAACEEPVTTNACQDLYVEYCGVCGSEYDWDDSLCLCVQTGTLSAADLPGYDCDDAGAQASCDDLQLDLADATPDGEAGCRSDLDALQASGVDACADAGIFYSFSCTW